MFKQIRAWQKQTFCLSPAHNPPMHVVRLPGVHKYSCPRCGHTTWVRVPEVRW